MRKRLKIKIFITIITTFILQILIINLIYCFLYEMKPQSTDYGYYYNEDLIFDLDTHTKTIELSSESKILILTDIHLYGISDKKTYKFISKMINDQNPEYIILLGDQCFTPYNYDAYKSLVKFFDSFQIPWSLVFGNHDNFGPANKKVLYNILLTSEYAIFDYGPSNFSGALNYVVNISVNSNIIYSFIMFDSHTTKIIDNPGLEEAQVNWYRWVINGLKTNISADIKTAAFIHVPIPEYIDAFNEGEIIYGAKNEDQCVPEVNTHIFDAILELDSTKYIFAGHDHINNYWSLYEGIYFVYATKSGFGSYYDKKILGCLTFDINGSNLELKGYIYAG